MYSIDWCRYCIWNEDFLLNCTHISQNKFHRKETETFKKFFLLLFNARGVIFLCVTRALLIRLFRLLRFLTKAKNQKKGHPYFFQRDSLPSNRIFWPFFELLRNSLQLYWPLVFSRKKISVEKEYNTVLHFNAK